MPRVLVLIGGFVAGLLQIIASILVFNDQTLAAYISICASVVGLVVFLLPFFAGEPTLTGVAWLFRVREHRPPRTEIDKVGGTVNGVILGAAIMAPIFSVSAAVLRSTLFQWGIESLVLGALMGMLAGGTLGGCHGYLFGINRAFDRFTGVMVLSTLSGLCGPFLLIFLLVATSEQGQNMTQAERNEFGVSLLLFCLFTGALGFIFGIYGGLSSTNNLLVEIENMENEGSKNRK